MPYDLQVDTDTLQHAAAYAKNVAQAISDAQSRLTHISSSLPNLANLSITLGSSLHFANIRGGSTLAAIRNASSAAERVADAADRFSGAITQASQIFKRYEGELADNRLATVGAAGAVAAGGWAGSIIGAQAGEQQNGSPGPQKEPSWLTTLVFEIAEKCGTVGTMLAPIWTMGDLLNNGLWLDGSLLGLSHVIEGDIKAVEGILELLRNDRKLEKLARMNPGQASATWKDRFFGLNNIFNSVGGASKAGSWLTRVKTNFGKMFSESFDEFAFVKGNRVGASLKVAGVAASGLIAGFDNYNEFKDKGGFKNPRFYFETLGETAADWLKNTAIAAGAAAVIGATFPAAPVVVVGLATVGISMGLDMLSEHFFDKKVTELVSDAVIDLGAKAYESATKATAAISGAISKGWNALFKSSKPAMGGTW